ncbi:TVP38/TMEM64 family protein [Candidatus Pelagibacter communis]|uniref:TVP38/TMEM64 family protein n=1 Tax=Pelagibacter ubique TaxID=198252 RepID=UPI00094C4C1B|nr:VTT domain-containing protein [Candidatus Pelagibacter ubique]|tara:strand:- start:1037 stop:1759 length:723 start_codon:yes stop_codon:yes gene_type:complete
MEKSKKIKLFIAIFYVTIVGLFLYYLFSKFSIQQLTSYEFIKDNIEYFSKIKETNYLLLSLAFLLFTVLWVFPFLGFGSPIALLGGFILGKWTGVFIVVLGLSIGATLLYIFGNYFLKELVREKFLNKFQSLEHKFKKSEFLYLLVYRAAGGIPWQLSCILPTLFNVKVKNFFLATFIGIIPQIFLVVSIGSGLETVINQNLEPPGIIDILSSPNIYLPLVVFLILVVATIILRKFFYKQ